MRMGNYQQYGTIWINFTHIILSKLSHKETHTHKHQDVIQIWYKDTKLTYAVRNQGRGYTHRWRDWK